MARILIMGAGEESKSALYLAALKEKYGNDIVLVTADEAKEQGLGLEDFANIPRMKISAPPIIPLIYSEYKSGKENRRERREQERKNKK